MTRNKITFLFTFYLEFYPLLAPERETLIGEKKIPFPIFENGEAQVITGF